MVKHKAFLLLLITSFLLSYSQTPSFSSEEPLEFALFEHIPTVFSASRIDEPILEAPAAISIITGEDLKKWGITDLPDAFRRIPGLDVTAFNGREWGVTARGFNERLDRRMLVLVDGMSIYTPLFSGVSWQTLPVSIEDIEKIEIIRGPNDTLYGFNAFNGVINITTKKPSQESSVQTKYLHGNYNRDQFEQKVGGSLPVNEDLSTHYWLRYSYLESEGYGDDRGKEFVDYRYLNNVSGRFHFPMENSTNLDYLFGYSYGPHGQGPIDAVGPFSIPIDRNYFFNYNLIKVNHKFNEYHNSSFQFYRWSLDQDAKYLSEGLPTRDHEQVQYDIEFQDNYSSQDGKIQTIWGGSYRHNAIESLLVRRDMGSDQSQTTRDNLFSIFVNNKWAFIENEPAINQLKLVSGIRAEHSRFIHNLELAPRISLLYSPVQQQFWRLTYARAFRLPSFMEEHITSFVPADTGATSQLLGNPDLKPEEVNSYELGYSGIFFDGNLSLDTDIYVADYKNIIHLISTTGPATRNTSLDNEVEARSYGLEFDVDWKIDKHWQIYGNYTYQYIRDNETSPVSRDFDDAAPHNKANIGFILNSVDQNWGPLLSNTTFNLNLNYRDSYIDYTETGTITSVFEIKENFGMDLSLSRSFFDEKMRVAVSAQNLLGHDHFEARFVEVPRLFHVSIVLEDWPWNLQD